MPFIQITVVRILHGENYYKRMLYDRIIVSIKMVTKNDIIKGYNRITRDREKEIETKMINYYFFYFLTVL